MDRAGDELFANATLALDRTRSAPDDGSGFAHVASAKALKSHCPSTR
jgi:hypothetical protein